MVLLRNDDYWREFVEINGVREQLPFVLLPQTEKFKSYVNNNIDLKKYYDKISIRIGSIVRLSNNPHDYFYGFDEDMEEVLGTQQTISYIDFYGGISFENPFDISALEYSEFGITEIKETIKY